MPTHERKSKSAILRNANARGEPDVYPQRKASCYKLFRITAQTWILDVNNLKAMMNVVIAILTTTKLAFINVLIYSLGNK